MGLQHGRKPISLDFGSIGGFFANCFNQSANCVVKKSPTGICIAGPRHRLQEKPWPAVTPSNNQSPQTQQLQRSFGPNQNAAHYL